MPPQLQGFDVVVGPGVALSGEAAGANRAFGDTLIGAVESQLVTAGFDVVPAGRDVGAVRVQLAATVAISRNQFIMVNGKPLESTEARVQVKVLGADGSLLDAFGAAGDPTEQDFASEVAVTLVDRMKQSRRLVALAGESRSPTPVAAEGSEPKADERPGQVAALKGPSTGSSLVQRTEQAMDEPRPRSSKPVVAVVAAPQPTAYALVIGVEKYRDLPPPVGAAADAQRFAQVLTGTFGVPEGNVRVALDERATRTDILRQLDWLKKGVSSGGRAYFFFAGHGAPEPTGEAAYLVPYDGDANDLEGTAISMNAVVAALEASNARESFAVVDACFSGQGDRSVLAPGLRPLVRKRELPVAPKVALFSASTSTETSGAVDGAGIFTKFVTQALSTGQADSDGDGQLSLEELASWVKPRVSRVARRGNRQQTPTLTLPAGMGAEDFIVGWGYPAQ